MSPPLRAWEIFEYPTWEVLYTPSFEVELKLANHVSDVP
jgi:hypothetical protein